MKVFLSYARKDGGLASQMARSLSRLGFKVWIPEDQVTRGDNWAKKIGKALDESDLMVILFTPKAMESDLLRQEVEFALTSQKYEGRVFTVFVGPTAKAGKDVPWILLELAGRYFQVDSTEDFEEVAKEIQSQCAQLQN